jgi:hypothetical protein
MIPLTLFLFVFFLYVVLRYFIRDRQNRAGNIYMVGSRYPILPEQVRAISIVGMGGIALLIVLITIMGYPLTPNQIASMLTVGLVIMGMQYFPLFIVGENGLVSLDTRINWSDVRSARVGENSIGGGRRIVIDFTATAKESTISLYIKEAQIDDFGKIIEEMTPGQLGR